MKKTPVLLLLTVTSLLFTTCSKEEYPKLSDFPKLSITNASSLVVYNNENSGARTSSTDYQGLFKITTNGTLESVKLIKLDGNEAENTTTDIWAMYEVNKDYLAIQGALMVGESQVAYGTLLVRKKDGAIFNLGTPSEIFFNDLWGQVIFQSDGFGNAYYESGISSNVIKLTLSDEEITKTDYLPQGQGGDIFAIDFNGNCIYSTDYVRIRKSTGGIYECKEVSNFWIGSNGKIYYPSSIVTQGELYSSSVSIINTIAVNNDSSISTDTVWVAPENEDPYFEGPSPIYDFLIKRPNSTIAVNRYDGGGGWEFFEDTNTLKRFPLPYFGSNYPTKIVVSPNYFYQTHGSKLYKISLEDYSYQLLLGEGQYEVYSMVVDANDLLQFSALRFSDGKKILAQIDSNGVFTILDEEQNKPATILQRLN